MRRSWPDASETSWASSTSLEGAVFEKAAPLVDFRLPLAELRRAGLEESVLFVGPAADGAPGALDEDDLARTRTRTPLPTAPTSSQARNAPPLPAGAPPLVAREVREARASRDFSAVSTPGSHWRIHPPSLVAAEEAAAPAVAPPADLPVLRIDRRRARGPRVRFDLAPLADASARALFGATTAARAARFGVALAALFALLAVKSLDARAPSVAELAVMGELPAPAPPRVDLAGVPIVRLADAPPAPPAAAPLPLTARIYARTIAPSRDAAPHAAIRAPRAPSRAATRVLPDGTRPAGAAHRLGIPAPEPRAHATIARL